MNQFETMGDWNGSEKQMKFISVFVKMISLKHCNMVTIQKLVAKAIESEYINNIIEEYISPMASTTRPQLRFLGFTTFKKIKI